MSGFLLLVAHVLTSTPVMYLDIAKGDALTVSSSGAAAGPTTIFDAPLNTNGLTAADPAASWPLTGVVTAPDHAWWADDDLGASGKSTTTFTKNSAPASVDTPFCPDGSHSDITSGCMTARRFDDVDDYYTATETTSFGIAGGDATACVIFRSNDASSDFLGGKRETGNGEGWSILGGATELIFYVENHAGKIGRGHV